MNIDATGVKRVVAAGQRVAVVREVTSSIGVDASRRPAPSVVWVTFSPFETNKLAWSASYFLYATESHVTGGTALWVASTTEEPATPGATYVFENDRFTSGSPPGGSDEGFAVTNLGTTNQIGLGLGQPANLNGRSIAMAPASVTTVLKNQTVSFSPTGTGWVFLSTYTVAGTVTTTIPADACKVEVEAGATRTLTFDDSTNTFKAS
jgi:hypothetical protein